MLAHWGMGINPKHQKDFLKESYRVPRQDTEDGFGLSLTIASRFSQVLVIRSRFHPNKGSFFWIEAGSEVLATTNDGRATKDPVASPDDWLASDS